MENVFNKALALAVIIDCRKTDSCKFKKKLGFNLHDAFNTKRHTALESIKDGCEGENMQTQYYVSGYKIIHYYSFQKKSINLFIVIELMTKKKK